MELSWTTDHRDGVTLVTCRLRNSGAVARRVRVVNELDGPVLPPRSHGEPLPGWDADGVTCRVEPDESAALGYAVPAPAVEPPATVASDEPARERVEAPGADSTAARPSEVTGVSQATATDAVRALGAYRPPRAALATPATDRPASGATTAPPNVDGEPRNGDGHEDGDNQDRESVSTASPSSAVADSASPNPTAASSSDPPTASSSDPPTASSPDSPTASPADPAAVDAWLDAVERRIARAERLDGADVPTATEAVAAVGGLEAIRELDGKVADDAARLRAVADRAAALADRAAEAEIPTEPLGQLA